MIEPSQYAEVRRIFLAAAELEPAARTVFLDEQCAGDTSMRTKIEGLLAHDSDPGNVIESAGAARMLSNETTGSFAHDLESFGEQIPKKIGQYDINRLIGMGGMGAVYEAKQGHPKRTVAIKVIRPGLLSREVTRRFAHEAEVLGRLQHPGIAQIYEAGFGDTGSGRQPYFAMEYVEGLTLTRYGKDHDLNLPRRLQLLLDVCDAVQHAHQKGVIHRDLKPDNILVSSDGLLKVLDFGIARVTNTESKITTIQTNAGQIIGTLAYMSPEQASGRTQAIDTRSDVYSLGMIGYELVADRSAYNVDEASITDAIRMITESEPARLSSIHRSLSGDIETIFTKALQKDPEHRYPSVEQFAADIRRFLADEPIVARTPSAIYQLRKFAKRNKPAVIGAALGVLSLLAGLVVSMDQARRAATARDAESLARSEAEFSRDIAQREANKAQAINTFLVQDMIASVDPGALGRDVTVAEVLANAGDRIGTAFANQPDVEAAVRMAIGQLYLSLGKYDEAEPLLSTACGLFDQHDPGRLNWAKCQLRLANLRRETTDFNAAENANREVLATIRFLYNNGRAEDEDLAAAMTGLGLTLHLKGELLESMELHQKSLAIRRERFGSRHLSVAESLGNVGDLHQAQGEFKDAAPFLQESLDIRRDLLGANHPDVAMGANTLGVVYYRVGNHKLAEPLMREALAIRRKLYGEGHLRSLVSLANLSSCIKAQGRLREAEKLYRETLQLKIEHLGRNHQSVARSMQNLAVLLRDQGELDEAMSLLSDAISIREELLGKDHPSVAISLTHLGTLHNIREEYALSEPILRRALAIQRKKLPPGNWWIDRTTMGLGTCLKGDRRFEEAEPLLLSAQKGLAESLGPSHPLARTATSRLVDLYEVWGKRHRAKPYLKESTAQTESR